jgi:hypothetical protein
MEANAFVNLLNSLHGLPPEQQKEVAKTSSKQLPPPDRKEVVIEAAQELPSEAKKEIGRSLGLPSQGTTNLVWVVVVSLMAVVALGSFATLVYLRVNDLQGGDVFLSLLWAILGGLFAVIGGQFLPRQS